jgi:hypothetical protein
MVTIYVLQSIIFLTVYCYPFIQGGECMRLSSLQKAGGISLITGSLLLVVYSIAFFTLLPYREMHTNYIAAVLNPYWIPIAIFAFVGMAMMMFGFTATYSRLYKNAGILAFAGYISIEIAYLIQASIVTWEICLYPVIAQNASSAMLLTQSLLRKSALFSLFHTALTISLFTGTTLFCISLFQSKAFPKSAGVLIFTGAISYGLGPMVSIYVAIGGIVIFSIGCLQTGFRLMKNNDECEVA